LHVLLHALGCLLGYRRRRLLNLVLALERQQPGDRGEGHGHDQRRQPGGDGRRQGQNRRRGERAQRVVTEHPGAAEHPGADPGALALDHELRLRELNLLASQAARLL
jgi:hypothetical protein